MVDCHMLVEFDNIKEFKSAEQKVQTLKDIKNDLVGSADVKQAYFDQALIETIMPLLAKEKNQPLPVLNETLSVLNCFFFDFPKSKACFVLFKDVIRESFSWLLQNWQEQGQQNSELLQDEVNHQENAKLKVTSFRVIRNLLKSGVLETSDLQDFSE